MALRSNRKTIQDKIQCDLGVCALIVYQTLCILRLNNFSMWRSLLEGKRRGREERWLRRRMRKRTLTWGSREAKWKNGRWKENGVLWMEKYDKKRGIERRGDWKAEERVKKGVHGAEHKKTECTTITYNFELKSYIFVCAIFQKRLKTTAEAQKL